MGIVFSYMEHMHKQQAVQRATIALAEPPPAYSPTHTKPRLEHVPLNIQMYAMAKEM